MWYVHTMKHYSAVERKAVWIRVVAMRMNPKNIMPSGRSQAQEISGYVTAVMWTGAFTDRRLVCGCQALGRGGIKEQLLSGHGLSFWGNENVLRVRDACTTLRMY